MSLNGLHVGKYGIVVTLTLNDIDTSTAADISGYTTRTVKLKPPSGVVKEKTASFVTDGSDGEIKFTIESGDIDAAGRWRLQVVLSNANSQLPSEIVDFSVGREL